MNGRQMAGHAARWLGVGALAVGVFSGVGCEQILGVDGKYELATTTAGGSGGSTSTGGDATGGTGGMTSSQGCMPGVSEACYSGPDGTEAVGLCAGGMHTCSADGVWGKCEGEVTPVEETCVTKTDEDCDNRECALWSSIWPATDGVVVMKARADSKGNVVVLGLFGGSLPFGATTLDSMTDGPVFLVKFNASGDVLWAKSFGGATPQFSGGFSLALDPSDNVYVGMTFQGTLDLSGSPLVADGYDFAVAKLTPTGAKAWANRYGGQNEQKLWDLAVDGAGKVRALGVYKNSVSIGGTFASGTGAFVAKISASDSFADNTLAYDFGEYVSPTFAFGPNNEWVLGGSCPNGATLGMKAYNPCGHFVAKFDASDAVKWVSFLPVVPQAVSLDSQGDVLVGSAFNNSITVGNTVLTSNGLSDIMVAKLSKMDGSAQWAKSWGGTDDDLYTELTLGSQDRFYLEFTSQGTIDFGNGPLMESGAGDVFVAAFDSDGSSRWSRVFGDATFQVAAASPRPDGKGIFVAVATVGDIDFGAGNLHSDTPALAMTLLAP